MEFESFLKNMTKQDTRILYLENEVNLRLTKTLNKGIMLSHGEFIARIDDEDIWTDPYKLEKQIHFLKKEFRILNLWNKCSCS